MTNAERQRKFRERHRGYFNRYRRSSPVARAGNAERQRRYRARWAGSRSPVVPFTRAQLEQRLSMWGGKCWLCRLPIPDGQRHVDHVKPIAKGGAHMLCNLRPACAECNIRKSDHWPLPALRYGGAP